MKHLLNNMSEDEKNRIREQHEGGMKVEISRFKTLLESTMGDVRPLISEQKAAPYLQSYSSIGEKQYPELGILSGPSYGWGEITFFTNYVDSDSQINQQKQVNYNCSKKTLINDNSDAVAINQLYTINNKPVNAAQTQAKLDGFCQKATQMGLDKRYEM